jgi:hypothetical protein
VGVAQKRGSVGGDGPSLSEGGDTGREGCEASQGGAVIMAVATVKEPSYLAEVETQGTAKRTASKVVTAAAVGTCWCLERV